MKYNIKLFLKTLIISLSCCALFVGIGYFYLDSKLNQPVKKEMVHEPYAYSLQNRGILFDISGHKTFFYLDFEEKSVTVIAAGIYEGANSIKGFPVDFTVESDYEMVSGIIDIIGGIELSVGNAELVYTGVQVVEILNTVPDYNEIKEEIIRKILYKISQNGFLRKDFLYIIENSNTNLTVPDFYYWQDEVSEICKTVRILF